MTMTMPPSVLVVGTIFIDCKGFAKQQYNPAARNLGAIRFVHGGVGRNVAENLANLGIATSFASSVDATAIGKEVTERLQRSKVDIGYMVESGQHGMGMWLAILDEKGELAGSISQMPDLALLQESVARKGKEMIRRSTHIALELDLNIQIVRSVIKLAEEEKKPLYGICGNLDVILRHRDILDHLDCFICNNFEADLFFEKDFTNMDIDLKQETIAQFADRTGMRSMVVTLGAGGAVYYDSQTKSAGHQPVFPVNPVDTSGAGDAFFSGTVMGLVMGLPLGQAVICGTKVAGWTIECAENTNLELPEKIELDEYFKNMK
ncbi:carbohydrate kinase family protein [Paenibacillus alkalitolerans]|uniref:carbohydrate kinase family protein n=1 Tax=Paenibacillus alkalitolerans TaxID=2799335 RepID=UPI001F457415|nr:PfkB family carbohydrate kinase [Paenibacillus alkalitolerans]